MSKDMIQFDINTSGLQDFELRFRAVDGFKDEIKDTLNRAVRAAAFNAEALAPRRSGKLASAIAVVDAEFHPGGAGGGGFYEARVEIDTFRAPHAFMVLEGTGLFGAHREWIHAVNGKFMHWVDQRGSMYLTDTRGQRPQTFWWESSQRVANEIVRNKVYSS